MDLGFNGFCCVFIGILLGLMGCFFFAGRALFYRVPYGVNGDGNRWTLAHWPVAFPIKSRSIRRKPWPDGRDDVRPLNIPTKFESAVSFLFSLYFPFFLAAVVNASTRWQLGRYRPFFLGATLFFLKQNSLKDKISILPSFNFRYFCDVGGVENGGRSAESGGSE